jgi:hypothetical protein
MCLTGSGEGYITRSFTICTPHRILSDQLKKNVMRGHVACVGGRRGAYRVFVGKPYGRNHFKDIHVDGRIILKLIFKKWDRGTDWIRLLQDRDR